MINSSNELIIENNGTDQNFYVLKQNKFDLLIYYKNDELELINFNNTDNFYINSNQTFNVNYSNYYFKVYFNNIFNGTLIRLNLNDSIIELNNNSSFKVNKYNGLKYKLSPQEKKNRKSYLELKIRAYNCPYNINYSKPVSREVIFKFNISLYGDNLTCLNEFDKQENQTNYHICPNLIKNDLNNSMSEIIYKIEISKKYNIIGNDININISPINSTFLDFDMDLNLTKCEKILKNYYNISSSDIITFIYIKKIVLI